MSARDRNTWTWTTSRKITVNSLINKFAVLATVFAFSVCSLHAENVATEVKAVGEGATYKDALYDALTNALAQTKGIQINSAQTRNSAYQEMVTQIDDQYSSDSKMITSTQGSIESKTGGFIQNYEILERSKNEDGLCEIVLLVKTSEYKTPGISPDNRRKIAVIPFRHQAESFQIGKDSVSADALCLEYTQGLVNEFTQTRKFSVVDREYTDEYQSESDYLKSDDVSPGEQAKIGQVLGVDYLVVGMVRDASVREDFFRIQLTGESGYRHSASMTVDYRIMVMATRQVKWSASVTTSLGDGFFRDQAAASSARRMTDKEMGDLLLAASAKELVNSAMDNIYPIRVAAVQSNGDIVLNQGGMSLEEGDRLELYSRGQGIVDPVTGESLGADEVFLGTIVITRVIPKMSYARFDGPADGTPSVGDICRRSKNDASSGAQNAGSGRESSVNRSSSGGVVLPFD